MGRLFASFWYNESGATAIEYGLIAALIAIAAIVAIQSLGTSVGNSFNNTSNSLDSAN